MEMIDHMTFSRRYRRRPWPDKEIHRSGDIGSPVYHPHTRTGSLDDSRRSSGSRTQQAAPLPDLLAAPGE
jgi:hypothetical protein